MKRVVQTPPAGADITHVKPPSAVWSPQKWTVATLTGSVLTSEIQGAGKTRRGSAHVNNFDIGKERDSNFIYGPAIPRTFFLGLTFNH